jgi:hypothetical protein
LDEKSQPKVSIRLAAMSDKTAHATCQCLHCQGLVEVPPGLAGELQCPHCGQPLDLPPAKSSAKWPLFLIVGILLAGGTIAAVYWTSNRSKKTAGPIAAAQAAPTAKPVSISTNNFTLTDVGFERQGSVRYLRGSLRNDLTRQRFGVRLQLDLLDADEGRVGSASDYRSVMQAGEVWQFRALALEPAAVTATIVSIQEDQ